MIELRKVEDSILNWKRLAHWDFLFLYCLGFYYILILNQHFNVVLRYIPLLMAIFAGFVYWRSSKKSLKIFSEEKYFLLSSQPLSLVIVTVGLCICFFSATLRQLPDVVGLYSYLTVFFGPIFLALAAFIVLPKNKFSIQIMTIACLSSFAFLLLTDFFHYARDIYRTGDIARGASHRWFSDGYLFFMPWLMLGFFRCEGVFQKTCVGLIIFVGIVFLLLPAGSRGGLIVIISQACLFLFLFFDKKYFFKYLIYFISLLISCFFLAYSVSKNTVYNSIFKKGIYIGDRMNDAWIPVIDFIRQEFWLGHGFGRAAWDQAYKLFLSQHIGWPGINYGGPHNQLLDVAFIGGIFAAIAYCALCFWVVKILFSLARKSSPQIAGTAIAALCSFVGLYLVRGLVESIRWEPLGIILTWCLLLSYLHQREVAKT